MAGLAGLLGHTAGFDSKGRIGGAAALGTLIAIVLLVMWNEVERHHRGDVRNPLNPIGRLLVVVYASP